MGEETHKGTILIIGGGMAGISAAVEAAESGISVILVEKLPYLGGNAIAMNRYFPKMCPPYCGMEINFRRIKDNPLIQYHVSTELSSVEKLEKGFRVQLISAPERVNDNCTLCGDCSAVCPAEGPDQFNQSMVRIPAISYPHDLAFPGRYYLNENTCSKKGCSICADACEYDAINLTARPITHTLEVQSIILATGWQSYNPKNIPEYLYGTHPDILSSLEMERLSAPNGPTAGKISCRSTDSPPKIIAFVQCVGSRDENHLPYCSGVCCSASLKQALHATEVLPEVEISIHYIDIRVTGRNEDFLKKVEDHPRIKLIKGKGSALHSSEDNNGLTLVAEDIESGRKVSSSADLVVLATGMIPNENQVATILPKNRSYTEHITLPQGIFLAGSATQPMDVSASVKSATASVLLGLMTSKE